MQPSDRYLEEIYRLTDAQRTERERAEITRIALLAAQHRAQQLQKQREDKRT